MTLKDVYGECEKDGVTVDCYKTEHAKAFSFPYDNGVIVIDDTKVKNSAEEKEIIMHEKIHIDLGAFYYFSTPYAVKGKMEKMVDKRAIKKLVPLDELKEALNQGIFEPWDLAEYFNVTDKFMAKVLDFYKIQLLDYRGEN